MKTKKWLNINNIIGLAFILFLVGAVIHGMWVRTFPQTYVIGTIHDWYKPLKGGHSVNFEYYYNGEKVESFSKVGDYLDQLREGDRYLVAIPEGYSKAGKLLLDKPVPDSVVAPEEGWDEIPEFLKEVESN